MIKVDFYLSLAIYLIIVLLFILGRWVFYKEQEIKFSDARFLSQCPICLHIYQDFNSSDYSICPRCKSYSKKEVAP